MLEKCKVNGKYCEGDWMGQDGLCDCMFEFPDERCKEAIKENKELLEEKKEVV